MSILQELVEAEEQMFRDSLNLPDWHYRDLPKILDTLFDEFVDLVGEENLQWITRAEYHLDDGLYKRGQVMISPQGMDNIRKYNETRN